MIKVLWPEYITLRVWADQLVSEYPSEYLPVLRNEDKWQEWAMVVAGSGIFAKIGIPKPLSIEGSAEVQNFPTWEIWAKAVYLTMYEQD